MINAQQLLNQIVGQLPRWGNAGRYDSAITLETEVYYDLGIYGTDLYEFVVWLNKNFGVATNLELGRYAPSEMPFLWVQQLIGRRKYDSLQLRDVIAAIEAKRWLIGKPAN